MPTKINEPCTLKTRQIIKNPALSIGMSPKNVNKYKKIAAAYGCYAPVIVTAPVNGMHMILEGSARLEACAQTGIGEIPAVMYQAENEAGELKLALMLSAIQDEGSALSEGELISRLINDYGISQRELVNLLGKSKAWVSKRIALTQNLTKVVKDMVIDGTLYPRSAEEVAKLPEDVQAVFAANVINSRLNKTEISQLVQCYKKTESDSVRRKIINSPLDALSMISVPVRKKSVGTKLNSPAQKFIGAVNYAIQMILKVLNMVEQADEELLCTAINQLSRLKDTARETETTLESLLADLQADDRLETKRPDVSLGKQGELTWQ